MTSLLEEPQTDKERRAARKKLHSEIATLNEDKERYSQVSRKNAADKKRILELDVLIEKAIIVGEDTAVLETERRRLKDLTVDQDRAIKSLSGVQTRIGNLQNRLRGELGNPKLVRELFIAKSTVRWAENRRADASKELTTIAEDSTDFKLWQAELSHSEELSKEAALDVDRLKWEIISE